MKEMYVGTKRLASKTGSQYQAIHPWDSIATVGFDCYLLGSSTTCGLDCSASRSIPVTNNKSSACDEAIHFLHLLFIYP